MEIAQVRVSGVHCTPVSLHRIPRGLMGGTVSIAYTDPIWDGLRKTVVFRGAAVKDVVNAGAVVTVPAEVISRAGAHLYVGVYGVDAENNVAIPTIWGYLGVVADAADPSGDETTDQSLPVWVQLEAMIGGLDMLSTEKKDSLVAALNEVATKCSNDNVKMNVADGYVRYSGDGGQTWSDLIALAALMGESGEPGIPGKNGETPYIGDNGNWYIGETDTGLQAQGESGKDGADANVTSENISAALGYTPANEQTVTELQSDLELLKEEVLGASELIGGAE